MQGSRSGIKTKIELLSIFKDNLIKFLDALIEQFPKEGDFIYLRLILSDQIPINDAMKIFTQRILPHVDLIKNKDERFFTESTDLFEGLAKDKVNYFKNIWFSNVLTDEDKEQLWKWFRLFGNLAVKYSEFEQV